MAGHDQRCHILLPAMIHDPLYLAWCAERGIHAIRGCPGNLDVRVGIAFVVVHQDQEVVVGMAHGCRDSAQAHVRAAAVTAKGDDVDRLVFHEALAHLGAQGRCYTQCPGAGAAQLRVHPRHAPRRRVVGGVGYIHAPGCPQNNRPGSSRLRHQPHDLRGLAALTGAVAGCVIFLVRNLLDTLERFQVLRRFGFHECAHLFVSFLASRVCELTHHPRSPIH